MKGFITSLRITSLKDQGLLSSSEVLSNGHTITTGFPDFEYDTIAGISPNVYTCRTKKYYIVYVYRQAYEHTLWILPSNSENQL